MLSIIVLLLTGLSAASQKNYFLKIIPIDKDAVFVTNILKPDTAFINKNDCILYVNSIQPILQAKGYITASVDSVKYDSTSAVAMLYIGEVYRWSSITTNDESRKWLSRINRDEIIFDNRIINPDQLNSVQQKMLNYFENNGYPFAKIFLDSIQVNDSAVSGRLNIIAGPLYYVDSISITGNAKISNEYLQNFLEIKNGSVYNKEKLQRISSQLKKLTYVEEEFPPQFRWGTSGGIVELFLKQKKSSQVNFIIGFLPNNDQLSNKKMLITGEGLLNLKNAFGTGEVIGLIWQKLQVNSQRLNINYQQPYLLKTPFGIDFGFDILKKDSSYLNFDFKLGAQYAMNAQQSAKIFFQQFNTIVSNVNTNQILQTRKLPNEADVKVTNVGIEYAINTTNYIYNPVRGFEMLFVASTGNKIIKPNNQILELKDNTDPAFSFKSLYDTIKTKSYQLRNLLTAAKYFPLGNKQRSTVKTAINAGYLMSGNIFRNELFQIGGYRLLRGFDEQSQYLSQYAIATLEYRYLVGENSYFNVFADGGWGKNASRGINTNYTYLGTGLGMAFETKIGLFNLAWAVGKRNDTPFNLRQSKIHFGFINYF